MPGNGRALAKARSYRAARSRVFDTADTKGVRGLQIATRSWGVLDHPLGEGADATLLDEDHGSEDEAVAAAAAAAATVAAAAVRSAGTKKQAAVTKATGVDAFASGGRWRPYSAAAASGGGARHRRTVQAANDTQWRRRARRAGGLPRGSAPSVDGEDRLPGASAAGRGPHTARHLRGALQQNSKNLQPGRTQHQWTLTPLLVALPVDAASCVHVLCAAIAPVYC